MRAQRSRAARTVVLPAQQFVHTETAGGLVLLGSAAIALLWANSPLAGSYERLWHTPLTFQFGGFTLSHDLREWINDALMVIFFFVVGLEVKREFVLGELSDRRRASLPIVAALGGMVVPALLYTLWNYGGAGSHGWGIPMATDIAFALGVLALLGSRLPVSARIFLLALATVDDIGAIVVIALFYTQELSLGALMGAGGMVLVIIAMRRAGVVNLLYYLPVGVLLWYAMLLSGVHATLAGVVLGLLAPTRPLFSPGAFNSQAADLVAEVDSALASRDRHRADLALGELEELTIGTEAPADRLVRLLHPWSSFLVLPLFALANAGVSLGASAARQALSSPISRGIFVGLALGKLVGIFGFSWLAVRLGAARMLDEIGWTQFAGISVLAGIGFTVSLFIAELAFLDGGPGVEAKIAILAASLVAGIAGYLLLRFVPARTPRG